MVNLWLFGTVLISFFVTLAIMPFWIKKAKEIDLVWEDMNKLDHRKKAGSGGIVFVLGTVIGILFYIAIQTFVFKEIDVTTISIFAILSSVLLVAGVGLVDDLFGWKKGGMSMRSRLILVLFSSIPLMVIDAGSSDILGVHLGILYPLIIIPIGFVGATVTFNFLEGYNGLGTRQGILILSALAIVTYISGSSWLSLVALIMVAALIAFYFFNRYPLKVFPGDSLTYAVGAMIAAIAIMGNVEKISLIFFFPYILEVILKIRGGIKNIHNFGIPKEDGSLEMPYKKVYSLTHLSIKILKKIKPSHKVYEKDVVNLINAFQIVVIVFAFFVTGNI